MKLFCPLLFLVLSLVSQVYAEATSPEQISIGLIYPLTGTMSMFGEDMAKALPLLEEKLNASQSKYRFTLLLEDGKFGQSNAAITAAKKLVEVDGVRFLVVGSSGEILQIAPYVESAKVLAVAGFASNPAVRGAGDFVFRTYIDLERGMEVVVSELKEKKRERIALISEEASFCLGNKDSLQKFLGEKIVFNEDFAPGEADFKTLLAKARSKKPQAYYLNVAAPASFTALVRELRDKFISEPIYTYYVPTMKDVQQALGSSLNGVRYLDFPEVRDSSSDFQEFLRHFQSKNGEPKAAFNFRTNYNAFNVVVDGILERGNNPVAVRDFLTTYDRPSATGRLRFDAQGDVQELNLVLKTFGE